MSGYRPPLPAPGDLIRWPAGFGQRFTVFVDTEEEFDWTGPFRREARSVEATRAIPEAARRFGEGGAGLTFLVDHPIATDPAAIDRLHEALTLPHTAVGTQLHPWVNPPFDEPVTTANSYVGTLPRALEAAKLDVLTQAITDAFATRPIVYRAGRYGIGPATFDLLRERGYRIDTSIRSCFDYSAGGGPDFSAHGIDAWHAGSLVELPLTTVFTGALRGQGAWLDAAARRLPVATGLLSRAGLLNRVALTPEEMPLVEALEAVRIAAGEGLALLNFSFHSPTLEAGHTPYVRDAADLKAFWRWWDAVLALLARLGIAYADMDAITDACGDPTRDLGADGAGGL